MWWLTPGRTYFDPLFQYHFPPKNNNVTIQTCVAVHPGVQLDRVRAGFVRPVRIPDVGGRGRVDAGRAASCRGRAYGRRPDLQRPRRPYHHGGEATLHLVYFRSVSCIIEVSYPVWADAVG